MHMDYYKSIKELLINNELIKKAKDYSKNRSDLMTRYKVGKLLSEAGKRYGEGIIKEYSTQLITDVGKNYDITTLKRLRQFYNIIQKGATLWHQLSWSHYKELLPLKNIDKINFYIKLIINNNLGVRELSRRIKNNEYERLDVDARNKLINNKPIELIDTVKDPILIKNMYDKFEISERMLQKLILENIEDFLLELGEGYAFIKSEYKIKIGNYFNYIDILLFNYIYNCFVVLELKVTELKKEHIGQIEVYMNYIDKHVKSVNQNKTIGIIIVKENDKFIIRYRSDDRIIAREYQLI